MNDKKRIEDLERRVRELEARPVMPTVIVVQPAPVPQILPWYPWTPTPQPFGEPWITYTTTTVIS